MGTQETDPAREQVAGGAVYEIAKRSLDLVAACAGLVVLAPFLAVVAILIKLDSSGPVFYRGVRTGRHGRPFRVWKFRSMAVGSEAAASSTGKNDPRVTRVGRWIRRHKVDELPELINVVTGEMSLVGPRPEVPRYTDLYEGEEKLILTVPPGITDYSSIHFIQLGEVLGEGDPDAAFEERVLPTKNRLRVQYVKDRCLTLDLKLIFRTVWRVLLPMVTLGRARSRGAE